MAPTGSLPVTSNCDVETLTPIALCVNSASPIPGPGRLEATWGPSA